MTVLITTSILFFGALLAGFLGSLSGLGGGLVVVPLLVLGLGADIHYAIGTSLIAVIATSTASSCAYVKEGYSNVRIGILLETATTIGALGGVALAMQLPTAALSTLFGIFLFYCAVSTLFPNKTIVASTTPDPIAAKLKLNSSYPVNIGYQYYTVRHVPWGYAIMLLAGALSGILGIGSGVLKVVALDKVMGLPFKVSTTTSNFMIGVTAAASAGLYLSLGYIDPVLTLPIVIGVTLGSLIGARLLPHVKTKVLRQVFAFLVFVIGIQMIFEALGHNIF